MAATTDNRRRRRRVRNPPERETPAMAAKVVSRPVKLVLTRRQMFGPVGGRPQTEQHVILGAKRRRICCLPGAPFTADPPLRGG